MNKASLFLIMDARRTYISTISFGLALLAACASVAFAIPNNTPGCGDFYGRPHLGQCILLLNELGEDKRQHFMTVPPQVDTRFPGVTDTAYAQRFTLPWVRTDHECSVALLSVLTPVSYWRYSWIVRSLRNIVNTELTSDVNIAPFSVLRQCLVMANTGGYRQIRKLASFSFPEWSGHWDLLGTIAGSPGLLMVLFEKNSLYEHFLLSGYGASHYDAARELPDGRFQVVWAGAAMNALLNSTQPLPLLRPKNLTQPDGGTSSS